MTASDASLRILLVEDSAMGREVLAGFLRRSGHEPSCAATAAEAVGMATGEAFDLVFMDLELPDMSGVEAAARIRQARPGLPIVAISGHAAEDARDKCLAAGMNGFLGKPVRAAGLDAAIEQALGRAPASGTAAPQAPDLDPALLQRVTAAFREDAPRLLAELRDGLARADAPGVARAAHTLHGSMRYFDATRAIAVARALERAAGEADWAAAERLVPEVVQGVERLLAGLGGAPGR